MQIKLNAEIRSKMEFDIWKKTKMHLKIQFDINKYVHNVVSTVVRPNVCDSINFGAWNVFLINLTLTMYSQKLCVFLGF